MPQHTKILAAISQPRKKAAPALPQAKQTSSERKEKREESKITRDQIDAAVAEWHAENHAKAVELGERFNKKPRYFLDRLYQGGAHMVNHQEKVNPYNAFKAEKAAQLFGKTAPELHEEFHDEYAALTPEEKADLVERFTEQKEELPKICRDTPRARMQDVSNTVRNIQMLFQGLSVRVGVEGFFCIVRNNPDFYMIPQWYFTSVELERYMPIAVRRRWDTCEVGTRLEAFAVAGCDTMNLLRTTKQKVDFLKGEIRDGIRSGLAEITKREKIVMQYMFYTEDIVLRFGVVLIGWTAEKFCNPSELSSSVAVLTTLRDAIKSGACKWVKLTATELKERKAQWKADVASGKVLARSRNPRSDLGVKRPRPRQRDAAAASDDNDDDGDDEDDEEDQEDVDDAEEVDGVTGITTQAPAAAPPKKRRRAADKAIPGAPATSKKGPPKPTRGKENRARTAAAKGKPMRDDATTRAVLMRMKSRKQKSNTIISDEEDDAAASPAASAPAAASTSAPASTVASAPVASGSAAAAPVALAAFTAGTTEACIDPLLTMTT
ncbi:hypothetical protein B0H15DRAFT_949910 [Mycena belliarum]|uniref:Uncharacterized protein n=1 Tax=Mycena belliarum TaxID=1033014 RepID=A0AAD6XRH5_9AGAR|nr:hypothetical protein B0H15DRAFT_949910 [Mycena belliae]